MSTVTEVRFTGNSSSLEEPILEQEKGGCALRVNEIAASSINTVASAVNILDTKQTILYTYAFSVLSAVVMNYLPRVILNTLGKRNPSLNSVAGYLCFAALAVKFLQNRRVMVDTLAKVTSEEIQSSGFNKPNSTLDKTEKWTSQNKELFETTCDIALVCCNPTIGLLRMMTNLEEYI
jgi:hypothetical protein